MCYKHLSIEERESLLVMKESMSIRSIAKLLGRAPATLSRELKRNSSEQGYSASQAEKKYQERKQKANKPLKIKDKRLCEYVKEKLNEYWSPEQISGRLKIENAEFQISFNTIYRALKSGLLPKELIGKLRKRGLKVVKSSKETRGRIHGYKTIHERPKKANTREQYGHWEGDTIRGALNKGCLATFVDRKSRYLVASLMPDRKAKTLTNATTLTFKNMKKSKCRTITVDHGNEFFDYPNIESQLNVKVYFADPYCSWQRGTNENTNGLLRQYFPKKFNFLSLSDSQLQDVVLQLNNRPRKILGFKTPLEVFGRL